MIIASQNEGGRRITRAVSKSHWGYSLFDGRVRTIQSTITGSDGKAYTVSLSAEDLVEIDAARRQYAELMKEQPGQLGVVERVKAMGEKQAREPWIKTAKEDGETES